MEFKTNLIVIISFYDWLLQNHLSSNVLKDSKPFQKHLQNKTSDEFGKSHLGLTKETIRSQASN